MPTLGLARFASSTVMGAQVYEHAIDLRAETALRAISSGWTVKRPVVRSLRSPLDGNRRIPMGALLNSSPRTRRAMGRAIYPRNCVVHRMDVGLPPSTQGDILTLHDIVSWRFSDEGPRVSAAAEELRRADAIITVSMFSAEEIVHYFGTRDPIVIPNGVDHERFGGAAPADAAALNRLGIKRPFVLAAGGSSRRKNLEGLASAWASVCRGRPDLSLVLAGPESSRRTALFRGLENVRLVGRLEDSILPRVLAASAVLVVPSLYEGFGLPALEGMAAGVPVVAARASSLPEVVGDGGILVEPTSEGLAAGILWATSGDSEVLRIVERGRLRSREFTWEKSVAAHAQVWASVSARRGGCP